MQDKKSLEQRLREIEKETEEAWNAKNKRLDELEKEVVAKKNQITNEKNELKKIKKERKKLSGGFFGKLFNKSKYAQNQDALKKLDQKIQKAKENLEKLEKELEKLNNPYNDPDYNRLRQIWVSGARETTEIEEQIKEAELQESVADVQQALGNNNLLVFADTKNARTYGTRGAVSASMKIDGNNRGYVANPVSIIPMSDGIHSISFTLSFSDGEIYTKEFQFSIQNNNRFFVVDSINCTVSVSASTVNVLKCDDLTQFLTQAKLNPSDLASYLKKL